MSSQESYTRGCVDADELYNYFKPSLISSTFAGAKHLGPKLRPVCGAVEAPCGQLSNNLSEIINAITKFEDKHESECRSSEEMRSEVKKVNSKLKEEREAARRLDEEQNMGGEGRTSPNMTSKWSQMDPRTTQTLFKNRMFFVFCFFTVFMKIRPKMA